ILSILRNGNIWLCNSLRKTWRQTRMCVDWLRQRDSFLCLWMHADYQHSFGARSMLGRRGRVWLAAILYLAVAGVPSQAQAADCQPGLERDEPVRCRFFVEYRAPGTNKVDDRITSRI